MKRYSQRPFPAYAYIPGQNPHPEKEGGHMANRGPLQINSFCIDYPRESEEYLYGVDLLNFGMYWEAHVYFEALWNYVGRKGDVANFLKGLIKIAAAGVKILMHQQEIAQEHLNRAHELLQPFENEVMGGLSISSLLNIKLDDLLVKNLRLSLL